MDSAQKQRLLLSAQPLVEREGFNVSVRSIVRAAGVGIGTFYRCWGTKEALFEPIVAAHLAAFAEDATSALAIDVATAFFALLDRIADRCDASAAARQSLADAPPETADATAGARDGLTTAVSAVLVRSQSAGVVRRDVDADEVLALVASACMASNSKVPRTPSRRLVAVLADGLRAT